MSATTYDLVIIGGGQAAVPLASALTGKGKRVALVESTHLGGSCVNFGCTPTKAAITSAQYAHHARRAHEYGVSTGQVTVDFGAVIARARKIAEESRHELTNVAETMEGLDLITAVGALDGRDGDLFVVSLGDRTVLAREVLLNTGTTSAIPPIDGLDGIDFITSENWLYHTTLPDHIMMIGGGYIGLEMGQFYRRMGSKVTIINTGERIAMREDEDIAKVMHEVLVDEGIEFMLDTEIKRVTQNGETISLELETKDGATTLTGSHVFVATGRTPNTGTLGLDTVGVKTDEKGIVEVDPTLRSNVPGIWAAGDIRGGPMFTHTSWDDNRILTSQMIGDGSRTTERVIPYAMFIDPQLGRVGLTEKEAREQYDNVKIARYNMSDSGKAIELGETKGLIKVIVDGTNDRILGAAVLAPQGAELVHVYIDLMNADAPYTVVEQAVHIHPTLAEDLQSVMGKFEDA